MKNVKYDTLKNLCAPYDLLEWFSAKYGKSGADVCALAKEACRQNPEWTIWLTVRFLPLKRVVAFGLECVRPVYTGKEKCARHLMKRLEGWSRKSLASTEAHIKSLEEKIYNLYQNEPKLRAMRELEMLVDLAGAPFQDNYTPAQHPVEYAIDSAAKAYAATRVSALFSNTYDKKRYAEQLSAFGKIALTYWEEPEKNVLKRKNTHDIVPPPVEGEQHGHKESRPLPPPGSGGLPEHGSGEGILEIGPAADPGHVPIQSQAD